MGSGRDNPVELDQKTRIPQVASDGVLPPLITGLSHVPLASEALSARVEWWKLRNDLYSDSRYNSISPSKVTQAFATGRQSAFDSFYIIASEVIQMVLALTSFSIGRKSMGCGGALDSELRLMACVTQQRRRSQGLCWWWEMWKGAGKATWGHVLKASTWIQQWL